MTTILSAGWSPFMRSVTVGTSAVQLSALIAAIDPGFPVRCVLVRVESDITANTGNIYVGNASVSSTNCGQHLVASQDANIAVFDSGLTLTSDIWMVSDTAGQQVNVTALGQQM